MQTRQDWSKRRWLLGAGSLVALLVARRSNAQATSTIVQPVPADAAAFIERAFLLQRQALDSGDQGYGALVVRDGQILGESQSRVVVDRDPTAHAEMQAIRDAARRLGSRDLGGCTLYSSSPPCPMCEAAAYWAGIEHMVYGRGAQAGGRPQLCA